PWDVWMLGRAPDDGYVESDARPCLRDRSLHAAAVAVQLAGDIDGGLREVREVRLGLEAFCESYVPDFPEHVPRLATERDCREVEAVVENARVDMDAAVVVGGLNVVAHVRGLRVTADDGFVVGGARRSERTNGYAIDGGTEDFCADEPVRTVRGLAEPPLLDHGPERVGKMLVERTCLAVIAESRGELRDAVRKLMGDDIDRCGEANEDASIGVTVDHLTTVPERVFEIRSVVHGGIETHSATVDGGTTEDLREKIVRRAAPVVGLVDLDIRAARFVLAHHELSGQTEGVVSGVDVATFPR